MRDLVTYFIQGPYLGRTKFQPNLPYNIWSGTSVFSKTPFTYTNCLPSYWQPFV